MAITDIGRLQKMVKFVAWVIHGVPKLDHITYLLHLLNCLIVENRLKLKTACFMYKVARGEVASLPPNLLFMFSRIQQVMKSTRRTRDSLVTSVCH